MKWTAVLAAQLLLLTLIGSLVLGAVCVFMPRYSGVGGHSLALDHSGNPAIAYHEISGRNLKYAHWDGKRWTFETVDRPGCVGLHPSLAFDTSGNPAISYSDITIGSNLKFAHRNGETWVVETIDSGSCSSLAFDDSGNPAIAYFSSRETTSDNIELRCARWNEAGWSLESVDSVGSVEGDISMAFDTSGHPSITYVASRDLKIARWDGSTWALETLVSAQAGMDTSLAFDSTGNPVIAHVLRSCSLKLAHWNGTNWEVGTVDNSSVCRGYTSLVFDGSGHPGISYCRGSSDVRFAGWNGTGWLLETVDTVGEVGDTSLAFDTKQCMRALTVAWLCTTRGSVWPPRMRHWTPLNYDPTSQHPTTSLSAFCQPMGANPALTTHGADPTRLSMTRGDKIAEQLE